MDDSLVVISPRHGIRPCFDGSNLACTRAQAPAPATGYQLVPRLESTSDSSDSPDSPDSLDSGDLTTCPEGSLLVEH